MAPDVPPVPAAALSAGGWRETERTEGVAFDARVVRVEAATVVFEDRRLGERVREATGLDYPWRFFVAGRLELRPAAPPSRALTALVADRAHAGFAERLEERGLSEVRRVERPPAADEGFADGARVAGYDGLCRVGGASVRVRGWLAVRPDERANGSFLLAGGAYPTAVRGAADPGVADRLAAAFDAGAFGAELFDLMRAAGSPENEE